MGKQTEPDPPAGNRSARRLRRLGRAGVGSRIVPVARGPRARLLGLALLSREAAGSGLLIPRCSSVHTFGMRFALDLSFLGAEGEVLAEHRAVSPGRIVTHRGAVSVLEVPSNSEAGSPATPAGRPQRMSANEVKVPTLSLERLQGVLDQGAWGRFQVGLDSARRMLDGRRIWNVNSTSAGGGVAEMLWSWVGLANGLGVDMRWLTIGGNGEFFPLTKRIHNLLHGEVGDGGELGERERGVYERVCAENAALVAERLAPGDVVFLHDPQTAGLAPHLAGEEHVLVWRCHVGADVANDQTEIAWDFLEPYLLSADAMVFSRAAYVPDCCEGLLTGIVPPSIDAFSPKNQDTEPERAWAVLRAAGLLADDGGNGWEPTFTRHDGGPGRVRRRCELTSEAGPPPPGAPLVVQVSRWDRLKDPIGVMRGFAKIAAAHPDTWLVLAGPSVSSVSDDPEGAEVLAEVESDWRELPEEVRARVVLASLPMDDLEENAAIVNALQRQATVVVQKSLKEGFGLTVTEAMWKGRPVLASSIGGIGDQIEDGVDGVLLANPLDLDGFAAELDRLLSSPERAGAIGEAAREKVRREFLEDRHTLQYVELLERLLG